MNKLIGAVLAGAVIGGSAMVLVNDREATPAVPRNDIDAFNARVAESATLDETFVAATLRDWGAADADTALRALASIEPPAARRSAALALLDIIGDDVAGANRVAAALIAAERPAFRADWLGRLAGRDPEGAMQEMLRFVSRTQQRMAAERIATAWAAQDPEAALAQAAVLPDDLAATFREHVISEWARLDAGAVLTWLETANPAAADISGAIMLLSLDPERLLAVADRRSDELGTSLEITALGVLAQQDAQAALDRVEAMAAGPQRDQAAMMVGIAYAIEDAQSAIDWIERMLPASPNARMLVAMGLAEEDPVRALDMLSEGPATQETQMLLGLLVQAAAQDPDQARSMADSLAVRADRRSSTFLANLISNWAGRDTEGALNWVVESDAEMDPALLGNAAAQLASRDPRAAAGYVERIPERYRDAWITRTAGPYGGADLDGALNWIASYRGQAVFDVAYPQLIMQAARANPGRAAQLLEQEGTALQRDAAASVASSWAEQDGAAAIRWAAGLNHDDARVQALVGVTRTVARLSDPAQARALLETSIDDDEIRAQVSQEAGLGN